MPMDYTPYMGITYIPYMEFINNYVKVFFHKRNVLHSLPCLKHFFR